MSGRGDILGARGSQTSDVFLVTCTGYRSASVESGQNSGEIFFFHSTLKWFSYLECYLFFLTFLIFSKTRVHYLFELLPHDW